MGDAGRRTIIGCRNHRPGCLSSPAPHAPPPGSSPPHLASPRAAWARAPASESE